MSMESIPKIFISYSWNESDFVVELAERLCSHGVNVVLDKWELREGQDKFVFMERCVNDPDISKVLIVSDKQYAEKADARKGGVGDETVIISSEVYGKVTQEKFIPIVTEYNSNGEPYLPVYIKTRIYIDLSSDDTFEENYEKLLRVIYEKPLYKKPKIGSRPSWLEEENKSFFPVEDSIKQLKGVTSVKRQKQAAIKFIDEYIEMLKDYADIDSDKADVVFDKFEEMLSARNIFLNYLDVLYQSELDFSETITENLSELYNTLTTIEAFKSRQIQVSDEKLEIYRIHVWELLICITTYLLHMKDYETLGGILNHSYYLESYGGRKQYFTYSKFYHYSQVIENEYKPKSEFKNKFTLVGDCLMNRREKKPIYTKRNMAKADLFLYQVYKGFEFVDDGYYNHWFPQLYVYLTIYADNLEWGRLKSRKYCERFMKLYCLDSIDELKERLSKCITEREMRYRGAYDSVPAIISYIDLDTVGSIV